MTQIGTQFTSKKDAIIANIAFSGLSAWACNKAYNNFIESGFTYDVGLDFGLCGAFGVIEGLALHNAVTGFINDDFHN